MKAVQNTIKNNKKIRIFMVFLLLSLIFWFLIKLSREYYGTIKLSVNYTDIPKNKILQSYDNELIEVKLKTSGFNLFRKRMANENVFISLKNSKYLKGTTHYLLTSALLDRLDEKFSKSKVVAIIPDTLYVNLSKSISKKLKVVPDLDLQYQTGYNLSGNLQISPNYVTVTGPKSILDSIQVVGTKKLVLTNLNDTINEQIAVLKAKNTTVRYSDETIKINGLIEKFTERSLTSKYSIKNKPKTYVLSAFPKEVKLVFQVGLSDFKKIDTDNFKVVCDYKQSLDNDLNYLIPKVVKKPSFVKDVKIVPQKIEFLLEK